MRTNTKPKIDHTEDTKTRMTTGIFSSRTEEWATPQYVYDELNAEFDFQLDVCATEENKKCDRYFDKATDGLKQDWSPYRCFMNPPYGKDIERWIRKAYDESLRGATVVCLVHARTDTKWWHRYAMKASEIRFVRGRLKFGDGSQSAPFPSCIIIFREGMDNTNPYNAPLCKSVSFNPRGGRQTEMFGTAETSQVAAMPFTETEVLREQAASSGSVKNENLPRNAETPRLFQEEL